MSTSLVEVLLNKFRKEEETLVNEEIKIDITTKSIKLTDDKKEQNKVTEISKLDEDNKPYALKTFDATMSSYHYKKNVKKLMNTFDDNDNKKKKQEYVVIEKLSDIK